jgi:hypothetical protein
MKLSLSLLILASLSAAAAEKPQTVTTSSGARYVRSTRYSALGAAWRDPRGLIWSDTALDSKGVPIAMTYRGAEKYCASIDARMPTFDEVLDLVADMGGSSVRVDASDAQKYIMPQSGYYERSENGNELTFVTAEHFYFQVLAHFSAPKHGVNDQYLAYSNGTGSSNGDNGVCTVTRTDMPPFSEGLPLLGVASAYMRCELVDPSNDGEAYLFPRCVKKDR